MRLNFINFKGGIGKSTSTSVVSQILALSGYKVLIVSCDSQTDSDSLFDTEDVDIDKEIYRRLFLGRFEDESDFNSLIYPSNFTGIHILAADREELKYINDQLTYEAVKNESEEANLLFGQNISLMDKYYDFILFDCNTDEKDRVCISALWASERVYTPAEPNETSYKGIKRLMFKIDEGNSKYGLDIDYRGIFLIKTKSRSRCTREMIKSFNDLLPSLFIPIPIRECDTVNASWSSYTPLYDYRQGSTYGNRSNAFSDYILLVTYMYIMDEEHTHKFWQTYLKTTSDEGKGGEE